MKKIIIIPSLLIYAKALSQQPVTGLWLTTQIPITLNKNWQLHNDGSYRTLGNSIVPLQYLCRTGLRYNINNNFAVAGGVALFFTRTTFLKQNNEFGKEFRFWEELTYKSTFTNKLQLLSRFRIEQRSFAATNTKPAFKAYRYRIKSLLQQQLNNKWTLQLADEYMQQSVNNSLLFDQNRVLINANYLLSKQELLTIGYMWVKRPANVYQHILHISFQKTLTLHAKQ